MIHHPEFIRRFHSLTVDLLSEEDPTGELTSLKSVIGLLHTLIQDGRIEEVNMLFRRYYPAYYRGEPNIYTILSGLNHN